MVVHEKVFNNGCPITWSRCRYGELHTEAAQHLEDRIVARLGAWGEGLVQALAAEAGAFGNRAHALRRGDAADPGEEGRRASSLTDEAT
jgi:hypothetical protein